MKSCRCARISRLRSSSWPYASSSSWVFCTMRRLVIDAPMSVSAPQPTMVTHSSVVMRARLASTPELSIRLTSTTIARPATISSTLTVMEINAAFFTLT